MTVPEGLQRLQMEFQLGLGKYWQEVVCKIDWATDRYFGEISSSSAWPLGNLSSRFYLCLFWHF